MTFASYNPATGLEVWHGKIASTDDVRSAINEAHGAFDEWSSIDFDKRAEYCQRFVIQLMQNGSKLAECISQEMGKPLWESKQEVLAIKNKIAISIKAYNERCPERHDISGGSYLATRHRPHGVVAVLGPFNFPGHLPNGHIVPALLAGNTVLFKPSEKCPKVGELYFDLWQKTGIPKGVMHLLQGPKEVAKQIIADSRVRGIFFTGSVRAGMAIQKQSADFCDRIVALEMGGNNPLVVSDVQNIEAASLAIIQSAFITSGQRCSAARRLILIENSQTQKLLEQLVRLTKAIHIGAYTDFPEPYMGPVISQDSANSLLSAQHNCVARGGKVLAEMQTQNAFVTPAIIDMTGCQMEDEEYFGPFLQCIRVADLNQAIKVANETRFGLTAGILTDKKKEYTTFFNRVRAGVINWNAPLTGASSSSPFGGIGKSGNFHPSGYYAADYCAYPVASHEKEELTMPEEFPPGMPRL
jgi:succinylglutamic semialdehyde dehydrogenase